jgi:hypothetical protein
MAHEPTAPKEDPDAQTFEQEAAESQVGLVREFLYFLRYNKKWWLTPIILILLLFGVLVFLGGTPVAPFIYTIF